MNQTRLPVCSRGTGTLGPCVLARVPAASTTPPCPGSRPEGRPRSARWRNGRRREGPAGTRTTRTEATAVLRLTHSGSQFVDKWAAGDSSEIGKRLAGVNISSLWIYSHTYRVLAFITHETGPAQILRHEIKPLKVMLEGLKQGSMWEERGGGGAWGRMGQSEGVLTSSGDCARASSVCRDPGMLWFNLKATERDRPLLQQGSRNLQSEPDGENYHRFKKMHDFFFCTANCIYLPCKVWVHHLHLVLQLALVCPQQLQSTTETQTRFTPWQLFTQSCRLVDHVTSALEAGDRVPIAGQRVALGLRKCSLEFVTLIIQYM